MARRRGRRRSTRTAKRRRGRGTFRGRRGFVSLPPKAATLFAGGLAGGVAFDLALRYIPQIPASMKNGVGRIISKAVITAVVAYGVKRFAKSSAGATGVLIGAALSEATPYVKKTLGLQGYGDPDGVDNFSAPQLAGRIVVGPDGVPVQVYDTGT